MIVANIAMNHLEEMGYPMEIEVVKTIHGSTEFRAKINCCYAFRFWVTTITISGGVQAVVDRIIETIETFDLTK